MIFLWCIVAWSYFAYVAIVCLDLVTQTEEKVCYLVVYHITLMMWLWAFVRTMFVKTNTVPNMYYLPEEIVDQVKHQTSRTERYELLKNASETFQFHTVTGDGDIRYCDTCQCLKPDRCHHCSICQACVLKMDHHCPWVNNCVGFYNYKYFILMLIYASLMCALITSTTARFTLEMYKGRLDTSHQLLVKNVNVLLLQFISLGFLLATVGLVVYHIKLVCKNKTTLETIYSPRFKDKSHNRGYDWGTSANFQQVFGTRPWTWLLPIFTGIGDGVAFPIPTPRGEVHPTPSYDTMGTTEQQRQTCDLDTGANS